MKKITLLTLLLIFTSQFCISQNIIAKRVKINNPNRDQLIKIKEIGIDLVCGALFIDNNVILEIGEHDLNALTEKGIAYTVLVDDLMAEAKERSQTELPLAKAQLEAMKSRGPSKRSISTKSTAVNNYIQYEGASEVDWAVPQNFNLGSMLGCLTYSEMLAELDEMRALYPHLISVKTDASPGTVTHGNSFTNGGEYDTWAGQPIYYVRISDNPDTDETNEPESLYSGMTHSREVSSMMNLMYYMWYILENYDSDAGIKNLVDNHEMYFIPVANPDGLMWNEQRSPNGNGLQRKNLGPYNTGDNESRGVDLNRNYDYFWGGHSEYANGTTGSSPYTSDQTYRGPSAFSEPETQIVRNFSATRQFKTAMNHHASSNLIPHAYNGYPDSPGSGREAEYHKFCHDMTRYNRYIYGEAPDILTIANGDMSDWMLGGATDLNGSNGSEQGILALAPENGSWVTSDNEGGFWPSATKIVEIAQRAVRMNLVNAYHSGKFAHFHDLNPSDVTSTSGNLEFGLEFIGQTLGDITLNVTPVSSNITSITTPLTQTGWTKLEQRNVTTAYTLDAGIQPNDEIEFQVTLSNDDGYVMYRANIIKSYNPSVLFLDNPDNDNMTNWTASGGSWGTTTDAYSGTRAITDSPSGAYSNNQTKTLTLNSTVDLSTSTSAVVQFFAKWDIERNFDYVQIEGSTNGSTWIPLNGKYTKPGSSLSTNRYSSNNSSNTSTGKSTNDQNNQPTGESIYDADTMDKWVMEEISIDNVENSFLIGAENARFRFVFDSDNSNRADGYPTTFDGFNFDDFKVVDIKIPCDNSVPPTNIVASTITTLSATIEWDNIPSATYDLRYKETNSNNWMEITNISTNNYTLSGLDDSTDYEVQISTRCSLNNSTYSSSTNFRTLTTVPCVGTPISKFPYSENFDLGIGDWTQDTEDDGNWTNYSGTTPSNTTTGPSDDISGGGRYFYTESSDGTDPGFDATVYLVSPCIELTNFTNASLSFYRHMYGANIGTLSLEITVDNGSTWSTLFSLSGNQGNSWILETIDLNTYSMQTIKLRFKGETGSSFRSDMAIDQINITADEASFTPIASCKNINITLDTDGNANIVASDVNDGNSIGDLSINISNFTCENIGANYVTLTATAPNDTNNTDTCIATVTVSQQDPPTPDNCWDNYVYNDTNCTWENQGTRPEQPTATNCWDNYQFNTESCTWENQGTQPEQPTATNCWDDYQFNSETCKWENEGTQPVEPTATNCWDDYQFNSENCTWENEGTQPEQPTATNCWDDYQFNSESCKWENQGAQPAEPTTECYETATFNNSTCKWEVTDNGSGNTYYKDNDNDGYGNPSSSVYDCSVPVGYVSDNMDCDDTNNTIYPGAQEIANDGIDQDCNGSDETTLDNDQFDFKEISVTPNPFNNAISIQLPTGQNAETFNIKVFDLNGRLVIDRVYSSSNNRIDVDNLDKLEQALYLFKIVNTKTGTSTFQRLIKH